MMMTINNRIINIINKEYKKFKLQKNPTCYFYDLGQITKNINELSVRPKQVDLFYAMKANNNKKIMKCVTSNKNVSGIEIASFGELKQALKYYDSSRIIFTGPGKTYKELYYSVKNNIKYINVESVVEAIRINEIALKLNKKNVDILLRINLDYSIENADEKMSGCSTKMGIDQCEYYEAYKIINSLERVNVVGIHVFAASGILDYNMLINSNKYIFDLVKEIEKNSNKIDVIDLGGGFGIDYSNNGVKFDVKSYFEKLNELIVEYGYENKKIIIELGTYLVGNAGYYTAKIIDIKKVKNKKHIIVAGGVNHMGLPLEMRRKHPVFIIPQKEKKLYEFQPFINNEVVDISGPLCMVSDKLSWDDFISEAHIGDIVVFCQSGAYCYGEGMINFLSHELPNEKIIEGSD